MPKGLFILHHYAYEQIYGQEARTDIDKLVEIISPVLTAADVSKNPALLKHVEVIFSGWGGPKLDQAFLDAAPNLQAIFYGAGSIKGMVTPEFWKKNIPITSSYAGNAVPVAEFTLAQIILSMKRMWELGPRYRRTRERGELRVPGMFNSTVGLVSLGMIGSRVAELLKPFDTKVIAYDPFASAETVREWGVELVTLEEVFRRSDVVSLHTPWLPETVGMVNAKLLASMKPNATLINTARGAIINEADLASVLMSRPDLWALLDVTYPEPPKADSPLWTLPNVMLTPHIAGSVGPECKRLGRIVVEELTRWLNKQPLQWAIGEKQAQVMA
jgi:phosphoglycerate dehydrogenase-like enzyme